LTTQEKNKRLTWGWRYYHPLKYQLPKTPPTIAIPHASALLDSKPLWPTVGMVASIQIWEDKPAYRVNMADTTDGRIDRQKLEADIFMFSSVPDRNFLIKSEPSKWYQIPTPTPFKIKKHKRTRPTEKKKKKKLDSPGLVRRGKAISHRSLQQPQLKKDQKYIKKMIQVLSSDPTESC
jgi:hypothetical protein